MGLVALAGGGTSAASISAGLAVLGLGSMLLGVGTVALVGYNLYRFVKENDGKRPI